MWLPHQDLSIGDGPRPRPPALVRPRPSVSQSVGRPAAHLF